MAGLYLIKGYRHGDAHPMLSSDIVARNLRRGFETCLMLDLNVLAYMEDVIHGRRTLQETGLDKAVAMLNSTAGLVLVPGPSLHETATHRLEARRVAYETFLTTYCPTYGDAPNTIGGVTERLQKGIKQLLAPYYATLLKIRLLTIQSSSQPVEKFREILRFQCDDLDYFTLIPLELAKYVLCDVSAITQDSFRTFCAKVRRIVVKPPTRKTSDQLFRDCLNAAYDVFYYHLSCMSQALAPLDGLKQDMWILTGDEGLACLADAIFFDANLPPLFGATPGRVPYRDDCVYFRQCDRLVVAAGARRPGIPTPGGYGEIVARSLDKITACEKQFRMLLT